MPKKVNGISTKGMSVEDFVEEHLADPHGLYDDGDKLAEIIADIESKPPKSEKSNIFKDKVATYKRALDDMEGDDDEGKPSAAKKAKTDTAVARNERRITSGANIVIRNIIPFLQLDE